MGKGRREFEHSKVREIHRKELWIVSVPLYSYCPKVIPACHYHRRVRQA